MLIKILTSKKIISLPDTYLISTNYDVEDVKSITGLGFDVGPKNSANILLDLGQTKSALDIIREEMDMSLSEAKDYLGI